MCKGRSISQDYNKYQCHTDILGGIWPSFPYKKWEGAFIRYGAFIRIYKVHQFLHCPNFSDYYGMNCFFFRCLCPKSHTGKNCETEINVCLTNSPCRNGAPCSITNEGYRCDCPLGFEGFNCENGRVFSFFILSFLLFLVYTFSF